MFRYRPLKFIFLATFVFLLTGKTAFAQDPHISAQASINPQSIFINEYGVVNISLKIPAGFHLYSMINIEDGPIPLTVKIKSEALSPFGNFFGTRPKVKFDDGFEKKIEYYNDFASYKINVKGNSNFSGNIPVIINGQICDDKSCYTQHIETELKINIKNGTPGKKYSNPQKLNGEEFSKNRIIGNITAKSSREKINNPEKLGLFAFILMAVIAGFGALLTPCVFPMIPITISFFSKYSNISFKKNLIMASVYGGSIILVYTIPGVIISMIFGAGSMQAISTHILFNIFISMLLLFFGFNLMGFFELELPSWLINKAADAEHKNAAKKNSLTGEMAAVFFMAVTFTLVSFSCTVGFIGGWVLPLAARGDAFYPMIGMIGFSSAFALPFFILALFPAAAQKLQGKAGEWMVYVKTIFGAIELAAAFKFLSNIDLQLELGILHRDTVLIIWTAIFILTALYILKVLNFKKSTSGAKKPGVLNIIIALMLIFSAAFSYLRIGNNNPMGGMIDGWLPPVPYPSFNEKNNDSNYSDESIIEDNLEKAKQIAQKVNKPLFVDFTGYQCANCRQMESGIFPLEDVRNILSKMVKVKLYTDGSKEVHKKQRAYQLEKFNTAVLPFYVIQNPYDDSVIATFSSLANSKDEFINFLKNGLKKWNSNKAVSNNLTIEKTGDNVPEKSIKKDKNSQPIDFTLFTLKDNEPFKLSSLQGSYVFINIWASWCAPCKSELKKAIIPVLKEFESVKFITISIDEKESLPAAQNFIDQLNYSQSINLKSNSDIENSQLPEQMKELAGLPSSFLINPKGIIIWSKSKSVEKDELKMLFKKNIKKNILQETSK